MSEFWDIAAPLTELTAREIAHGNQTRYTVFAAAVLKIGHPISKEGCLICVDESLTQLKKAYKQYLIMENSKKGVSSVKIKGGRDLMFEGARYNSETLTDEVAIRMLEKHPEYERFLVVPNSFGKAPKESPKEKVSEDTKDEKPKTVKRSPSKKVVNESN